jgi:aryl-alcohol dehydrogenase-like predicted oxidoreductase
MQKQNRREFLKSSIAGAGLLYFNEGAGLAQSPANVVKKQATDQVLLGSTGIKLSRLAMGSGTNGWNHSSDQTRLGLKAFSDLLCYGYDQGINFWESADAYGSHIYLREGIKQVGRDKLVILTKTRAQTAREMREDLDRFRRELGTEHIDILLLHCMLSSRWPEERQGAMEVLSEARHRGIIRAHGVSCHDFGALQTAARHPWVQVDLARINPIQRHMDADPASVVNVLRQMKKAGKGAIGMKILAQGDLAKNVDKALEYAAKLDCLDTFTIGFTSPKQLEEVIQKVPKLSVS